MMTLRQFARAHATGRLQVPAGTAEAEAVAQARADESVRKFIGDKQIRKAIYVKDRLVNLVV